MINQLPEVLILRIFSFLPTKTVIARSVLSKQWRSSWKMVPNLEFDSDGYKSDHLTFSESVSKSFLSHKVPVLESLHLTFRSDKVSPLDINVAWVGIAFARHLRELVLEVHPEYENFTFPSSLCTCNTLETLKLKLFVIVDSPSPVL
ncbi:FBD-associated F-box protein [Cardamine amara subsp. amara]|uniref:FBD-associated F-box protein n=1 Tax=Cardamine amara subsp. amara TaxID=228776 RepID=A0ABD0ZVG2_CARAN